jgi:hypothetical protein
MNMLADMGNVSNGFVGQWVIVAFSFFGGIGGLLAAASYFATRREVEKLDERLTKQEETSEAIRSEMRSMKDDLTLSADKRSSVLHNRLNPVAENLASIKGSNEAFVVAFNNFTEVVKSLCKSSNSVHQ